jgi:secondary thiamine-phosphate synthase enzyme
MNWYKTTITIATEGRGFYDITERIKSKLKTWEPEEGIAFIFLQHTSASLVINENYAASAKRDMENFLEHLAPEGESWYAHTMEGKDDSPAHLRTIITHTSLTIPIENGQLALGTWQGIFLAEHRRRGHHRQIFLRVLAIN